jgi:hypothetical protein
MDSVQLVETGPAASTGEDTCACEDGCRCGSSAPASVDPQARRWAWWLRLATIGWNSLEAVIAIGGGMPAGSIALVGFGLDSVVEERELDSGVTVTIHFGYDGLLVSWCGWRPQCC